MAKTLPPPPAPLLSPLHDAAGFQRALGDWYRRQARVLPWRERPSLYGTVVSEFMLQQTQVKTVLPYFARWLATLPDFAALAAASEEQVLKLWEGLGYYSRARNLQRLAQAVVSRGGPPRTAAEWIELPGVGPYTAAAIASIASGDPVAVVDGNVVRILARLLADGREWRDSATAAKAFAPTATALLDGTDPGTHNQAMMELGATVCFRQSPLCTVCPVLAWCAAGRSGAAENFPRLAPKVIERREVTRVWCRGPRGLLLHRVDAGARRLAGIYELPTAEQAGLSVEQVARLPVLATKRRAITRFAISETVRAWDAAVASELNLAVGPAGLVWVTEAQLAEITLSGPHRRWTAELWAR